MLSSLRKKFTRKKKDAGEEASWIQTLSVRERIIAGTTAGLAVVSLGALMTFNPGGILPQQKQADSNSASIPRYTGNVGQTLRVGPMTGNRTFGGDGSDSSDMGFSSIPNMFGKIPSKLPGFEPPAGSLTLPSTIPLPDIHTPDGGSFSGGGGSSVPEYMTQAYATHAAVSNNARSAIDSSFSLEKMSDAPSGSGSNRFVTSYVESNSSGTPMEKVEIVTIAKTSDLQNIKTGSDALYNLVEDSGSVNILENNGDYIIFDVAGSSGYQLTKATVTDNAIVFAAYVNLTTNTMPDELRDDWIEKLKSFV